MHSLYDDFASYLNREDKESCVRLVLSSLESHAIDTLTLYNEILAPAIYAEVCTENQPEICVWEEHVRTSIVRTIIECCYPHIVRERDKRYGSTSKGKAVVVCPPGELHDIGARMVADFFTLCGFTAIFVGANTPQEDILNAILHVRPEYVAISVTGSFNLVVARNTLARVASLKPGLPFKVILGGQACLHNSRICQQMGSDMVLDTFADIQNLTERKGDASI
jgi:methanogenic corrinoid protein MtbC1